MESKICTYTEKNVRLQLVRISEENIDRLELRFNRKLISSWNTGIYGSKEARLSFISAIHQILVMRSSNLSHLTV